MNIHLKHPDILLKKIKKKLLGADQTAFMAHLDYFKDKIGIEIGGPSAIFQETEFLPVYKYAARVDGVNFSNSTIWEGEISEGMTYEYGGNKQGYQFISEGNDLSRIENDKYDFVLSSHSLEHLANALKGIKEWNRVLKPGGAMLIVVPDKRYTFDHKRPVTTFDHLLQDFKEEIGEDDLTHLEEVLKLHDLSRDPRARDINFRERSMNNFKNRCLHHHVFDKDLLRNIYDHFNIQNLMIKEEVPYHLTILGRTLK